MNNLFVLRYLKFSAKGTKREVFRMPIPGNLITADIQGEPYYQENLEKVAKHQRYLAGKQGSNPDSHTPKPAKATKKSKPAAPKADPRPPVTKPASSQQPEPKPTSAKYRGKKHKLVTKTTDKPSPARRSKLYFVSKRCKPTSSLRSVDESVAEGILRMEPRVDDEETDVQRASEESLKSIHDAPRVARDILTLQTPKKKSHADQFIFQRHTSIPTGSSGHDESSSLYVELGLKEFEVESDEDVPGIDAGVLDEGQAGPNPGDQDKGQAGPNPDEQDEGQAGPNPCDAAASQPLPSLVVHAGPNLEHMDLEATDVSTQPHSKQMDEGFTATAYLKVQENLKLTVEKQVILEEPASSTGTLSSLQHLAKDLSFGDLFFNDKSFKADNEKTTAKTEAESMVSVTIQQDTSLIPPMTTPIIDLTSRPESPNVYRPLYAIATETTTTTTTTIHPPPPQPQQSTTESMLMKRIGELEHIMVNLIQDNKHLEERLDKHGVCLYTLENLDIPSRDLQEADIKEILHQRMWETNSYKTHKDHMMLYEALEMSMNRDHSEELLKDLAKARKKKKKRRDSPKTPHGSPPHQPPPPPPPADLQMDDDMAPDAQAYSSDDDDIENAYIPKVNLRQDWWKPLEEDRPATPEPSWSKLLFDVPVPNNNWASALASTYSPPLEDSLLAQTGDMAMFMDWFCKRQGITKLNPKGSKPTLSISKMKEAYYPDVGLEQMVPDQMWIDEECKYDIAAIAVRTHMRILSVVRIKVFSMYGYDYIKKIVLCRVDLNVHVIAERDFKYMYPSDFEDLYLLNLQGHLNHLPPKDKKILTTAVNLWTRHLVIRQRVEDFQLEIKSYLTQLNLTKPRWDATSFEYKHDYMVIDSPRAVTFRDRYAVQMIMRFNKIHKFSDGTLHQIDEALDYWVKEIRVNRMNLSLNTRFWTRKDVDRSNEFMFTIQKRLKTRSIFCNLESFVGGRVRDGDYRLLKRTE
nr:hypothetical protein [Tanacetum cinerariifolium]